MTHSRWLQILSLSSAFAMSACATDPADDIDDSAPSQDGTKVHMMPMHTGDKVADAAPAGARLQFFGGPVLTHVDIHPVYWNANTQFQSNTNAFYKAVTNSA